MRCRVVVRWAWVVGAVVCLALPAAAGGSAGDYNARGVEYYNAGRWDEAIAYFERAYELVPGHATVRRNLCNVHQSRANELAKAADFKAAAEHLEVAISVDPENPSPLTQLGSYYLRLDMVNDAVFRLEEALELAPEDLNVHELLGDAYYKDNDLPSARVHWEWVLQQALNRPNLAKKIAKATREEAVEQDFSRSDSRHFRLNFPPGTPRRSLGRVLAHLERAYFEVGRKFGGVFPPTPIQVIVYNTKGFADVTQQGEHVGGLYDGKIRIPLLDMAGNTLDDEELKRRLFHEYTHVVVRYLAANNVPWWLNEGLAETFSREFGPHQTALLEQADEQGALFALSDLEGSQLNRLDVASLHLAYCQSHATVHYLWSRFGQRVLRAMMSSLAEGLEPEEALRTHYRRDYRKLEMEVAHHFGRLGR